MISEQLFDEYLGYILRGDRQSCVRIVDSLLGDNISITDLYLDLFQRSLYRVGELWEQNRISVAREHLATAITEGLLHQVYPRLFTNETGRERKKLVLACTADEFHQMGGKMAADLFEFHGWDSHFLGANTPVNHLLDYIQDTRPDRVGLSLSIYFNLPSLTAALDALRSDFPALDIIVGGQAFRWGGTEALKRYSGVEYIESVSDLEDVSG